MKHRIDRCQSLVADGAESTIATFYLGHYIPQATGECTNYMLMPQRESSVHYFDLYQAPFSIATVLGGARS